MRFNRAALWCAVALAVGVPSSGFCLSGPINIGAAPPTVGVNAAGTSITIGDSSAGAIRAAGTARAATGITTGALADAGIVAEITDTVVAAGPAGEIVLAVSEGVGATAAAEAVVACVASVVCAIAAGAVIAGVAALAHIHGNPDGSVDTDTGQPALVDPMVQWPGNDGAGHKIYFGDAQGACNSVPHDPTWSITATMLASNYARCDAADKNGPHGSLTYITAEVRPTQHCPVVGDTGLIPNGWSDGAGGLICPTPQSDHSTDPEVAKQAVGKIVHGNEQGVADAVSAATQNGVTVPMVPTAISGPAQQQGATTTTHTTNPDGSSTTQTQTQKYNYDYNNPDHVGIDTETQTQTQTLDANGNPVSTGTVTTHTGDGTGTGTGTGTGSGTDNKTPDLCALHPDVLACAKLGDPPTDKVPTSNVALPGYMPEALNLPASCPAPVVVAGKTVSYQQICDTAVQISPWVKVGAAFASLMLVVAAVRTM